MTTCSLSLFSHSHIRATHSKCKQIVWNVHTHTRVCVCTAIFLWLFLFLVALTLKKRKKKTMHNVSVNKCALRLNWRAGRPEWEGRWWRLTGARAGSGWIMDYWNGSNSHCFLRGAAALSGNQLLTLHHGIKDGKAAGGGSVEEGVEEWRLKLIRSGKENNDGMFASGNDKC